MVGPDSPRSRLDEIRLARRLTNAELARQTGIEPSALHKPLSGKRGISRKIAERLLPVLDVPYEVLYAPIGDPILPPRKSTVRERGRASGSSAGISDEVPVHGTAQAGPQGAFHLNMLEAPPIDWVGRPKGLQGVAGIFAIRIEGNSMAPWREPGELVFVNANRVVTPGCHVIAEVWSPEPGQPPRAFLKRLLRRTGSHVELEQYNPRKIMKFEAERVGRLYRVIEWPEALGI